MNPYLRNLALGGIIGIGVMSGGALALAQTSTTDAPGTTTAPPATAAPSPEPSTTTAPGSSVPETTAPPTTTPGTTPAAPGDQGSGGKVCDAPTGGRHGGPGGVGASDAELATQLGKTEDEVKAAEQAGRDAVKAKLDALPKPDRSTPPTAEQKAQMEAARKEAAALYEQTVADKLGISVDQLKAAQLAVAKAHLDKAVADGKLTQAEADAQYQRLQSGDLPLGGFGGHGGPGVGGKGCDGPMGGHGGPGWFGASDAELATQLGKTEDEVKAAEQAGRDAVKAKLDALPKPDRSTPPTAEQRAQMEAARKEAAALYEQTVADKLGIGVDQLKAAQLAVAKAHLDKAVADGRLTQAEADAQYQRLQSGDLPLGGFGGPGGLGGPGGHGPRGGR